MQKVIGKIGWTAFAFGAVYLFYITLFYFSFRSDYNFLLKKQAVVHNIFWRTAFYIHITGGMMALLTGIFQFVKYIRTKQLDLHRKLGKIYLVAIIFLGAPSGLFMAFYAEGGLLGQTGFTIMALAWLTCTYLAYEKIRKKDIDAHKAWMVRSFALTFAAVTLRLYVPVASDVFHLSPDFVETSSAWVSWLPNLFIAEVILFFFKKDL